MRIHRNWFVNYELTDVVNALYKAILLRGVEKHIVRENLSAKTYSLSPVLYGFKAETAIIKFRELKQHIRIVANEILSTYFPINPTLNNYYFDYDKYVDKEAGVETYTYGERWCYNHQMDNVLERLKKNIYTRQAVMVIYMPEDTSVKKWHIPCTLTHQFVYDGRMLNIIVNMRSQDFFRGLKYDVCIASFILQAYANALGVESGYVYFSVGDMHVYQDDVFEDIVDGDFTEFNPGFKLELKFNDYKRFKHEMVMLRDYEYYLRESGREIFDVNEFTIDLLKKFALAYRDRWLK